MVSAAAMIMAAAVIPAVVMAAIVSAGPADADAHGQRAPVGITVVRVAVIVRIGGIAVVDVDDLGIVVHDHGGSVVALRDLGRRRMGGRGRAVEHDRIVARAGGAEQGVAQSGGVTVGILVGNDDV